MGDNLPAAVNVCLAPDEPSPEEEEEVDAFPGCPNNTVSTAGVSALDGCLCAPGYTGPHIYIYIKYIFIYIYIYMFVYI